MRLDPNGGSEPGCVSVRWVVWMRSAASRLCYRIRFINVAAVCHSLSRPIDVGFVHMRGCLVSVEIELVQLLRRLLYVMLHQADYEDRVDYAVSPTSGRVGSHVCCLGLQSPAGESCP